VEYRSYAHRDGKLKAWEVTQGPWYATSIWMEGSAGTEVCRLALHYTAASKRGQYFCQLTDKEVDILGILFYILRTMARQGTGSRQSWPSHFETDAAEHLRMREDRLAADMHTGNLPAAMLKWTPVPRNPFHSGYIWYKVMKEAGYGVLYRDGAQPGSRQDPTRLDVFVSRDDALSVKAITHKILLDRSQAGPPSIPYNRFISKVTVDGLTSRDLSSRYRFTKAQLPSELDGERAGQLIRRGFVTSYLIAKVDHTPSDEEVNWVSFPREESLYEDLRHRGTTPLSIDDLNGLGSFALASILRNNPDIARPAQQIAGHTA
jgi:hypothetical protein